MTSETDIMHEAMIEASRRGHGLWRNNAGGFYDQAGNFIRTGLAKRSADTIGIRHPDGRFISIEFKAPGWKPPRKPSNSEAYQRFIGQVRWMRRIQAHGGLAGFARSVDEAISIIEEKENPNAWWLTDIGLDAGAISNPD